MPKLLNGILLAVTTSSVVVGCGAAEDGPPRESIAGKVTLDGKPVKKGFITFLPVGGNPEHIVSGLILDGEYSLTRAAGPTRGLHRVDITSREATGKVIKDRNDPENPTVVTRELIPPEFNVSSRLTAEVKADTDNRRDYELSSVKVAMRPRR